MKNKMTISELKKYIISEATRLYEKQMLKESESVSIDSETGEVFNFPDNIFTKQKEKDEHHEYYLLGFLKAIKNNEITSDSLEEIKDMLYQIYNIVGSDGYKDDMVFNVKKTDNSQVSIKGEMSKHNGITHKFEFICENGKCEKIYFKNF